MPNFFLIFFIALGVIAYSRIGALTKIGASGGSPNKLLADLLGKTKTDTDTIYLDEATRLKVGKSIIRWRNIAACLTGLFSLSLFMFPLIIVSGLGYLFLSILIATITAFIILREKRKRNFSESKTTLNESELSAGASQMPSRILPAITASPSLLHPIFMFSFIDMEFQFTYTSLVRKIILLKKPQIKGTPSPSQGTRYKLSVAKYQGPRGLKGIHCPAVQQRNSSLQRSNRNSQRQDFLKLFSCRWLFDFNREGMINLSKRKNGVIWN